MVSPLEFDEVPPDDTWGPFTLPRRQTGGSPQGMTLTLVADYSLRTRAWLPSAAIVALLVQSRVSQAGARTAINRLARRGALESSRKGRHSFYRLARPAAAVLKAGGAIIASFTAEAEAWNGAWTLIAFSLPRQEDTRRRALRARLKYLGYAPLYDGLWISPRPLCQEVEAALADTTRGSVTVFRARHIDVGAAVERNPLDAWDLASVAGRYEAFVARWSPMLPRVTDGDVEGAEALRARTTVMENYRHFVLQDPYLPLHLMPSGWLRQTARDVFTAVYDGLAEPASRYVHAVVACHANDQPPAIGTHTVADLLAGW